MADPIIDAAVAKVIDELVDAFFSGVELNMERNAVVAQVRAEVAKGMPLDQVHAYLRKLRDQELSGHKQP